MNNCTIHWSVKSRHFLPWVRLFKHINWDSVTLGVRDCQFLHYQFTVPPLQAGDINHWECHRKLIVVGMRTFYLYLWLLWLAGPGHCRRDTSQTRAEHLHRLFIVAAQKYLDLLLHGKVQVTTGKASSASYGHPSWLISITAIDKVTNKFRLLRFEAINCYSGWCLSIQNRFQLRTQYVTIIPITSIILHLRCQVLIQKCGDKLCLLLVQEVDTLTSTWTRCVHKVLFTSRDICLY